MSLHRRILVSIELLSIFSSETSILVLYIVT